MTRLEENTESRETVNDILVNFAKSVEHMSDQTAVSLKMTAMLVVMQDISKSLAIIDDALGGKK